MARVPTLCALLSGFSLLLHQAHADQIEPSATVTVNYSDNLLRSKPALESATVMDAGVGVRLAMDGRIFQIDGDAAFRRREYFGDTSGGDNLPVVNLLASAAIVPEVLTWVANESMGQVAPQAFDSLARNDQQNASYFSTGPSLYLPLGVRGRLQSDIRFGLVDYSGSTVDNRRYSGEIGLGRLLSSSSSVSLNYMRKKIEYDLEGFPPSTSDGAFVRYNLDSFRTNLVGEVGRETSRLGSGRLLSEPHLLAGLQRRITRRVTLSAEFAHGFSDAAENLRIDLRDNFNAGGIQNIQLVAEPFKSDRAYVNAIRGGGRLMCALQFDWTRERYLTRTNLNRKVYGSALAVDYWLSPVLSVAAKLTLQRENLVNAGLSSPYRSLTLGVNRQLGSSLRATLAVQRWQASGSIHAFRENRAMLSLTYAPNPIRHTLMDPAAGFRYFDSTRRAPSQIRQPGTSMPGQPASTGPAGDAPASDVPEDSSSPSN